MFRVDAVDNKTKHVSDELRLSNMLLVRHQTVIDNAVRPVINSSQSLPVWLGISIYNIISMDDKNQILTTKMLKQMVR
jgi:Neurotransmitter-gated ion-channel ligand binding domain